jgi:hypothetical protein
MYDPQTGRFMQMDPLGSVDGMNLYASYFVVNGIDPSGLKVPVPGQPKAEEISHSVYSYSKSSGYWTVSGSISTVAKIDDCCKDGVKITNGDRKYTLRIKIEGSFGSSIDVNAGGQKAASAGLKGPRASGTIDLSIENKECGGPFDTAEFCRSRELFAGASAETKLGTDSPILKKLNVGASFTIGVKGSVKSCASYHNGNLTLKTQFCGQSDINASFNFFDTSQTFWRPFKEKFSKGCFTVLDKTIALPAF